MKKLLILALSILLLTVCFASCKRYNTYIPKIADYTDYRTVLKYKSAPYVVRAENSKDVIIKSKEEYEAYLDNLCNDVITKTKEQYDAFGDEWQGSEAEFDYLWDDFQMIINHQTAIINSARDKYDEAFFEDNALILTRMITRSSGSIKLKVHKLYISENKVYVVIRTDYPSGDVRTDDMLYAFYAFAVDKDDVVNVNEVITLE
jgi:hypothetical protein